jgi:hypothetical protein
MQSARSDHERGHFVAQAVFLSALSIDEFDCPSNRISEMDLPFHDVCPGGRIRVFEVGHEHIGAGI